MSIHQVSTLSDLEEEYIENPGSYDKDKNFQRAQKFADAELKVTLDKIKKARQNYEQQESKRRRGMIPTYAKRREQLSQVANMISAGNEHIAAVKLNGTAVIVRCRERETTTMDTSYLCEVPAWRNMISISAGDYFTVGLKTDGTVSAIGNICNPIGDSVL